MRLTINGDPVAFDLEGERTLGEVAAAVGRWLGAAGFLVVSLAADGSELGPGPHSVVVRAVGFSTAQVDASPGGNRIWVKLQRAGS